MKKISADVKAIIDFTLPLVVTIILFILMFKFGFSKISEQRLEVNDAKKRQRTLTQKSALLSQVEDSVLSGSSSSVTALPESNPALSAISQLKDLASSKGIFITNLKTGSEAADKSGLKRIDITFEAEASRGIIIEFLNDISTLAPITLIDKLKLSETAGVSRASISVKAFWSELPKTLPPLDQVLNDLTPAERDTLNEVSALVQPNFIDIPASNPSGEIRQDPFSF